LFFPRYPGGFAPTRGEIRAAIAAGGSHAPNGDVPVPGGWLDAQISPELVYERLNKRYDTGVMPTRVVTVAFPKTAGVRSMSWLHPFDDMTLRALVGRCSAGIEAARDKGSVFNNQLEVAGAGWKTKPFGQANEERKAAGWRHLTSTWDGGGLGVFDVANYYPSISMEQLRSVLNSTFAPIGAQWATTRLIDLLARVGGTSGLPVGPEFSGLLGNVALTPLDKVMRELGPYVRWMDDLWTFPVDEQEFENHKKVIEETLSLMGLSLNPSKAQYLSSETEDGWDHIGHAGVEYSKGANGKTSQSDALEMFLEATQGGFVDDRMARYSLAVLTGSLNKPKAAEIEATAKYLLSRPDLFLEFPTQVGKFFATMSTNKQLRKKHVDDDWLDALITQPGGISREESRRLHACRVLASARTGKKIGAKLEKLAMDRTDLPVPVRAWAGHAWAAGTTTKPKNVIDAAIAVDDFFIRRSLMMGMPRGQQSNKKVRQGCDRLAALDADLEPTIQYVLQK
jgi:hypothetical protein